MRQDGHIFTGNGIVLEVKNMIVRKTDEWGKPFSGVANIIIAGGVAWVEAAHFDDFTKHDFTELERALKQYFKFDSVQYERRKKSRKKVVTV